MEIWKYIEGYEGYYQISSKGRLKSLPRTIVEKTGKTYVKQGRIMIPVIDRDGYYRVNLKVEGKVKRVAIHRLLALHFLEPVEGKNLVNHKDGKKLNIDLDNLEWSDYVDNNNHAFDTGLIGTGHKVSLVHIDTGAKHDFRSLTKASEFLDRHSGYVSKKLKEGITRLDVYEIVVN